MSRVNVVREALNERLYCAWRSLRVEPTGSFDIFALQKVVKGNFKLEGQALHDNSTGTLLRRSSFEYEKVDITIAGHFRLVLVLEKVVNYKWMHAEIQRRSRMSIIYSKIAA